MVAINFVDVDITQVGRKVERKIDMILYYYKVWKLDFVSLTDLVLHSATNLLPVCNYKVRQVLQSVAGVITKCVRYYKT